MFWGPLHLSRQVATWNQQTNWTKLLGVSRKRLYSGRILALYHDVLPRYLLNVSRQIVNKGCQYSYSWHWKVAFGVYLDWKLAHLSKHNRINYLAKWTLCLSQKKKNDIPHKRFLFIKNQFRHSFQSTEITKRCIHTSAVSFHASIYSTESLNTAAQANFRL